MISKQFGKSWRRVSMVAAVGFVLLSLWLARSVWAAGQNADLFGQIMSLQLNQPFPASLVSVADSSDKRGQIQTYYFLSGNYVYPHFVELESGRVVHTAIYIDAAHLAEYSQKLAEAGSPEVVLQNTENERIVGFPSKGWVFVVNAQQQPVVFEKMKPLSERTIVEEYDSDTVLAAADAPSGEPTAADQLLKYPNSVVKFAVEFYTTLLANPKLAMVVIGVVVALAVLVQVSLAIRRTVQAQRDAEIVRLMQQTAQTTRQFAAPIAETVGVPTQPFAGAGSAVPAFDVSVVEAVAPVAVAAESAPAVTPSTELANTAAAVPNPAAAAYQLPEQAILDQQLRYNPQLVAEQTQPTEMAAPAVAADPGEVETPTEPMPPVVVMPVAEPTPEAVVTQEMTPPVVAAPSPSSNFST